MKSRIQLIVGLSASLMTLPVRGAMATTLPGNAPVSEQEVQAFQTRVTGHYANFNVVAYVDKFLFKEMRTLVITYGITEFFLNDKNELMARDTFCHASHKANLPFQSTVPDAFTRAIKPRVAKVEVREENGSLFLWRPETPTPIGINLPDPSNQTLPKDPKDPRIADDDHDGKPGVTVKIRMYGRFDSELYIARREIFAYRLDLQADSTLDGHVSDHSEQLIVGSPLPFLRGQRSPLQHPDLTLSPIHFVPLDASYDCDRLMSERDDFFPQEPAVW